MNWELRLEQCYAELRIRVISYTTIPAVLRAYGIYEPRSRLLQEASYHEHFAAFANIGLQYSIRRALFSLDLSSTRFLVGRILTVIFSFHERGVLSIQSVTGPFTVLTHVSNFRYPRRTCLMLCGLMTAASFITENNNNECTIS